MKLSRNNKKPRTFKKKSKSVKRKKSIRRKRSNLRDGGVEEDLEIYTTELRNKLSGKKDVYILLSNLCNYFDNNIFNPIQKQYFFNTISWSIPSKENIDDIKEFIRYNNCPYILEIGSGLGLYASILKKDVIVNATDDFSWYKSEEKLFYTDVENIGYEYAINLYNDINACLFLCWPPRDHVLAEYCLKNFNGKYLIYIGQNKGGLCATNKFFDLLSECCEHVTKIIKEDGYPYNFLETTELSTYTKDQIYFYKITDIGKIILGLKKQDNLDGIESISFDKKFGNRLDNKITYTNVQCKFSFVLGKNRIKIVDKYGSKDVTYYYVSDACSYKFE